MKINIDEIKISIKFIENKKTKAILSLDFGEVVVKGFRISESQYENDLGDKLWLQPPSYVGGGRYHSIFFMADKEQWKNLEKRIWSEFKMKQDQYHKKKYDIPESEW